MLRRYLTIIAFAVAPQHAASQARPDTTQRRDTLPAHDTTTARANAWGTQLSVVAEPVERHVVRIEGLLGDGIGRYLQGLDGSGAGVVSPDGEIDTRRAWGGSASYEHPWSATLTSNFVAGRECLSRGI